MEKLILILFFFFYTHISQCISSTGLFAKLAVPLILEKLSSTSGSAKVSFGYIYKIVISRNNYILTTWAQKDSMETLAACAPVYGANILLPVIDEIFDALKVEVK